ncbi:ArdC-like ssDNA-binding domain-containing protein [Desulforhabdus amnigena]|uniref:N-terminal domain-containing protein n=1 Tax=Desulforhabdus amnigena TaxID=40218 RepID=A0A9W6FU93_9BACT|nr:ArdC-like ssDNA-binding domain-containing protein [Desulforhabdus amnigena]NLJ27468.1 hypothetical protein [Deltaproteobacteria bacterium]GLI34988.1 hypothetical protein DAMNIGENAA_24210 [Desulforhabdus amnigena]
MVERDTGIGGADEAPRPSQFEIKQRIDGAWRSLMEVLKESPERAISEFIEYSKSANIRRFSLLNQFFLYAQSWGKARFVLTKRAWERLGRTVKAGEKPYRVFVLLPISAGYSRRRGPGRRCYTGAEHGRCSGYVCMEHAEYDIS